MATGPNAVALLLVWIACVFVSLVVHELGHALAARHFGVRPAIELHALGGVTRMAGPALTRVESFWVTLFGPVAGIGLYVLTVAVNRSVDVGVDYLDPSTAALTPALIARTALGFLLFINLWWTVFNLLPILPLDGGQLLRSVLGPGNLKITEAIGVFLAGVLATLAAFRGNWYMAVLLGFLAWTNLRGNRGVLPGGPLRVRRRNHDRSSHASRRAIADTTGSFPPPDGPGGDVSHPQPGRDGSG